MNTVLTPREATNYVVSWLEENDNLDQLAKWLGEQPGFKYDGDASQSAIAVFETLREWADQED